MGVPGGLKAVNRTLGLVSGIIILVIGILTTMEGIARGVFNAPTTWSLDICQYLLIWAIFLGSAHAFQEKTHVSVDFIREGAGIRIGPKARRAMAVAGYLFALVYVGVLIWNSVDMFLYGLKWGKLTRGTVQIPVIWLYAAIFVGSVAMAVTLVSILISLFRGKKEYV